MNQQFLLVDKDFWSHLEIPQMFFWNQIVEDLPGSMLKLCFCLPHIQLCQSPTSCSMARSVAVCSAAGRAMVSQDPRRSSVGLKHVMCVPSSQPFAQHDLLCGCHGLSVQSDPLLQWWRNSWMELLVSLVEVTQRNRMELFEPWLWGSAREKGWGENLLCVWEKMRKIQNEKKSGDARRNQRSICSIVERREWAELSFCFRCSVHEQNVVFADLPTAVSVKTVPKCSAFLTVEYNISIYITCHWTDTPEKIFFFST